ncbi:MAG: glycosyltransferase family 4 protein [Gemmatimonadota bacterium]
MRLLHVVTAWPRDPDDIITPWLVALGDRLAARGHVVDVLAPAYRGQGGGASQGLTVRRFRYAPAQWERLTHEEATPDRLDRDRRWALLLPGYVMSGVASAWRLGRRFRYDAVHVHWAIPHGAAGWAAAAGARAAGAPGALVTTFYGAELRWAERRFRPAVAFLRWYCRRSHLVAISESTRAALAPYTARPVEVIPYGVPLPEAPPSGERALAEPTLLFVGRLVARKGVDRLLEALATLAGRRWRLEVVGFGPDRDALERQAAALGLAERVAFLGRVPNAELEAAYSRAYGFVLPATLDARADTEGLGVVLLEAMAYGVPVVATRMGGIVDIVEDGVNGWLVEDSVPALAAGVARLLDNPDQARGMGKRGRARVRDAFGWDSIVTRLEAVYARGPVDPAGGDA